MKHTQGEWSSKNGMVYRRHWTELYEFGGGLAGDVPVASVMGLNFYPKEEREANAKLIAAAPDMLKALIKVCEGLGNGADRQGLFKIANDSIKKATL